MVKSMALANVAETKPKLSRLHLVSTCRRQSHRGVDDLAASPTAPPPIPGSPERTSGGSAQRQCSGRQGTQRPGKPPSSAASLRGGAGLERSRVYVPAHTAKASRAR